MQQLKLLKQYQPGDMIDLETLLIEDIPRYELCGRYLRTQFQDNEMRFTKRFMEPLGNYLSMYDVKNRDDILKFYQWLWDNMRSYTYKEAFELSDAVFRAKVFSVIDVPSMVKELGHKRINTDGIELTNRVFNIVTGEFEDEPMSQVYEIHKVDGAKLEIDDDLYAIKCWCTSTDQEHWLWTDRISNGENIALKAIASTCMIYKPMLGKIKHIIRQGDVFIFEMTEEVEITEEDEVVTLPYEEYFKLLKSQS